MVRNRWIVLVVAVALLVAITTVPVGALQKASGPEGSAIVSAGADAGDGPWSGTWIGQAWNWLVSIFAEDNGGIVP